MYRLPAPLSLRRRVRLLVLLALVTLAIGASTQTAPARAAARTALLLPAFFVQLPVNPSGLGAPALQRSEFSLSSTYPGAVLHVYRPSIGRHPALIVSLGVAPPPPDDPSVVRFLQGLASAGIAVGLVQSPQLDAGYLEADAPALLVAAFQTMAQQPFVEPSQIGFVGLSVGGSLALLASADPSIRTQVRLVEAFGAYGSLPNLMRAAITRTIDLDSRETSWQPDAITVQAVRRNLIALLPSASDQTILQPFAGSGAPLPAEAPPALSPEGMTVFGLLSATSTAQFDGRYAALPPEAQSALAALSPEESLAQVRAPIFLMVDKGDPLVPYAESDQMAEDLVRLGHPAYFSRFDIFRHVEPTRGASLVILLRDLLRLLLHVNALLGRL